MYRHVGILVMSLVFVAITGIASANDQMVYVCVTGKGGPPCPAGATKYSPADFAAHFPPPVEYSVPDKACMVMLHGEMTHRFFNSVQHAGSQHGGQVWQISCIDPPKPR